MKIYRMQEPLLNQWEEKCKELMHEVGQQQKKRKIKIRQRRVRKRETKDLQILQERHKSAMKE